MRAEVKEEIGTFIFRAAPISFLYMSNGSKCNVKGVALWTHRELLTLQFYKAF